jgi:HlyD family secretion protein
MSNNNAINSRRGLKSPKVIGVIVAVFLICLIVIWLKVVRGSEQTGSDLVTFVAKRGPLTISVLESGTIKPRERLIIKNEVEGRTSIIRLIPEGTHVQKGDLLVELDVSTLEDTKIDQEIQVQNAEAAYINAKETLAVVENQAQSDIDVSKLTLKFAEQDLQQYKEGQYPKDEKTARNEITLREEELTRAQETLTWSLKLFEEKYLSNTDLQADKLAVTRSSNDLELAKEELRLLEEFTRQRNIDQFESDFHQAKMALERTQRKATADVVQAKADLKAKELEYMRQQDKLAKLEDQLVKATVLSPADGIAIYATSARRGHHHHDNQEPLDEGVEVFERQELIYLPTATLAMAEVDIHEASLKKVRLGLPAIVTVDALPGKTFFGSVENIAPLPDPQSMWMNPDLKVYNSEIYLEGDRPELRTGMSCKVEIIVEQYEDTVYIPVQAVIRIAGQPAVYVVNDGVIEEREVEIGFDNNRMVRIIDGIREGEVVLLTPPLKSASIEDASAVMQTERAESADTLEALKQRINEKLEEANGTQTGRPDTPLDPQERRRMQQRLLNAGPEQGEGPRQGRDARQQGSGRNQ